MKHDSSRWADTITIIDNFLTDPVLLNALNDDPWWDDGRASNYDWYERYSPPKTAMERYIDAVYHRAFPDIIAPDIIGFEYWGWTVRGGDRGIPIHVDHDEQLQHASSKLVTPQYITVFYSEWTDDATGGELLIYNKHKFDETPFFSESNEGLGERDKAHLGEPTIIHPRKNRLIIAPGCYYHEVLPLKSGTRRSINCNPWGPTSDGRSRIIDSL